MTQGDSEPAVKPPAKGRMATVLVAVIAAVLAVVLVIKSKPVPVPQHVTYICSETLKPFDYELKEGDSIPVLSPFTGKKTGYPAELCYWTKEGKIKETPTPVLLNELVGKPGPTFCPDCGRLVVGRNPPPQAGAAPPPTQAEYVASTATTQKTDK
jgi:hypothetical protein